MALAAGTMAAWRRIMRAVLACLLLAGCVGAGVGPSAAAGRLRRIQCRSDSLDQAALAGQRVAELCDQLHDVHDVAAADLADPQMRAEHSRTVRCELTVAERHEFRDHRAARGAGPSRQD